MPVHLSAALPDTDPEAKAPRLLVWLLLAVIVIGIGAALTLWKWPKGELAHDWYFWGWLSVVPTTVFALLFAARWHIYEQTMLKDEARSRQHLRAIERDVLFARRPLGLLASAYITAMGSGGADQRVVRQESMLRYQPVRGIGDSVSHTLIVRQNPEGFQADKRRTRRNALPLSDDDVLELFGSLIESLMPTLVRVPKDILVPVILNVSGNEFPLDIERQWCKVWQSFGLGKMKLDLHQVQAGLMALDEWMDETDRHRRERITLFINVQFLDDPADNSGEAATALLIGWPSRAGRLHLPVEAWLHRPVREILPNTTDALSTALRWGDVSVLNDIQIWTSGVSSEFLEIVARVVNESSRDAKLASVASVDASLGNVGSVAGWLAYALAAEQVKTTGKPQFLATRDAVGTVYGVIRTTLPNITELTSQP